MRIIQLQEHVAACLIDAEMRAERFGGCISDVFFKAAGSARLIDDLWCMVQD